MSLAARQAGKHLGGWHILWEGVEGTMDIDWGPVSSLCHINSEQVEAQKGRFCLYHIAANMGRAHFEES